MTDPRAPAAPAPGPAVSMAGGPELHGEPRPASWSLGLRIALAVAASYAALGLLAMRLAGASDYASPLYPAAGLALAAALVFGRSALIGTWLGAFAVNVGLGLLRPPGGPITLLVVAALIACGATLQAAVGASLVRRFVGRPTVLIEPGDILRFVLLGGLGACLVSASVATISLQLTGTLAPGETASNWLTWWMGDALGVVIGTPLALTLFGRPAADWRPRRRTVGLPMLLALALLIGAMFDFDRLDRRGMRAAFDRDADALASTVQARMDEPLHALQALHGTALAVGRMDHEDLARSARWWLSQTTELQAMGYSERVNLADIPAYEAKARAEGMPRYRIFDRDGGEARANDGFVLAMRQVEPPGVNTAALGVNVMSIPAARDAVLVAQRSGRPAATAGFKLTQSSADEAGMVLYQALYDGEPADEARRIASFRGVVFVTLRPEHTLQDLTGPDAPYLHWCLVDPDPMATRMRLAGNSDCRALLPTAGILQSERVMNLAGRQLVLRVAADEMSIPGQQREGAWLLALAGLAAVSMLGALLLTVTGRSRRTESAVRAGTSELRREMGERTLAVAALRDSEQRLRSILDHVPIGVMFLDTQGFLLDCNARMREMTGRSLERLRGQSVALLLHDDEVAPVRAMRRALLDGAPDAVLDCLRLRGAQGRELLVRIGATALRDDTGRMVSMVAVIEDITGQLQLQASEHALHRAEVASRAKSEFLSRMSHELRTPLNAMIGFAQLLGMDRDPPLAPRQREWVQEVQRAGWHLLEMINETLDLARIESGAVQLTLVPVAIGPLLRACRAMIASSASQRGLRIVESVNDDAQAVLADATRLKQILTNMLSNAVKYNRDGGSLRMSATRSTDGTVEIAVSDTGLGMTPAQLEALFQPYNRLGREHSGIEGTGIGMVISRRLAELMGGTLSARSESGVGSTFTLRLPMAQLDEAPVLPYSDTSPAPYQQRLVHYVEDNETNVEVMRGILSKRAQIKLEVSTLGLDGLAAVRRQRPDLILLDMQLPDISGLELLRHLKHDPDVASIPVVVVSADATAGNIQRALTMGAQHYVTKPLEVAGFLDLVDNILEAAETRWGL